MVHSAARDLNIHCSLLLNIARGQDAFRLNGFGCDYDGSARNIVWDHVVLFLVIRVLVVRPSKQVRPIRSRRQGRLILEEGC